MTSFSPELHQGKVAQSVASSLAIRLYIGNDPGGYKKALQRQVKFEARHPPSTNFVVHGKVYQN